VIDGPHPDSARDQSARVELDWRGSDHRYQWESGWIWFGHFQTSVWLEFEFAPSGFVIFPITHCSGEWWTLFHLRYDSLVGVVSLGLHDNESGGGLDGWLLDAGPAVLTESQRAWVNTALDDVDEEGISPSELLSRLIAVANIAELRILADDQMAEEGLDGDRWRPVEVGPPPAQD
jgi:hypothetical protein